MVNLFNFGDEVIYNNKKYILKNNVLKGTRKKKVKADEILARFILPNGKKEIVKKNILIEISKIKKRKFPKEFDNRVKNKKRSFTPISAKDLKDIKRLAKNLPYNEFKNFIKVETFTIGGRKNYDLFWKNGRWINIITAKSKDSALKPFYNYWRK